MPNQSQEQSTAGQEESAKLIWSHLPTIRLLQPPSGKFSTKTDERCFTYCSQTAIGRTEGSEPYCRALCMRRIFAHEVKRTLSTYPGRSQIEVDIKIPLPPEGQPKKVEPSASNDEPLSPQEGPRYWQKGYYLWFTKNRFAAEEKMETMAFDLEHQDQWRRYKEAINEEIRRRDQQKNRGIKDSSTTQLNDVKHPDVFNGQETFPDATPVTLLMPFPPPYLPIYNQIQRLVAPARKSLAITYSSLENGSHIELGRRIGKNAFSAEPYNLVCNVFKRVWENWKDSPPKDDSDEKGF